MGQLNEGDPTHCPIRHCSQSQAKAFDATGYTIDKDGARRLISELAQRLLGGVETAKGGAAANAHNRPPLFPEGQPWASSAASQAASENHRGED